MEDLLQIQIEFSEGLAQGEITNEAITTTISEAFLEIGIEPSAVQAGVKKIDLHKESQLGVDPGVAALVIATIGIGMDLIKLAADLYKQSTEQHLETKKHDQDVKLELARLELEQKKFEFEKQKHEAQLENGEDESKLDQELVRDLLDAVVITKLIEKHQIQYPEYKLDVIQRR
jgi:hypothetical protein